MANFKIALFVLTFFSFVFFSWGQAAVDEHCLGCICYGMTECNITRQCSGDICGPFAITWAYWADAGKPVLQGDSPDVAGAYAHCANDVNCASYAVVQYMTKFARECNGDGVINCDDYGRIHRLGPYGCAGALDEKFSQRYNTCKAASGKL